MKNRSVLPMRVAKYGYIFLSAVFCAVGVAIMLLPAPPMEAIGTFFGVAVLAYGVIKLVGYFSKDLFRLAFEYDLQFGILLCLLGIIILARRGNAVEFICVAYGISMVADGLFKAKIAFEARRFGIQQWWMTLLFALLAGVAGLLITVWPTAAVRMVKLLLGLSLLAEGLLGLSVAISLIKIVDHQQPEVIDVDTYEVWEE